MTFEEGLTAHFAVHPDLKDRLGERLFPIVYPQGHEGPAVTYTTRMAPRSLNQDGPHGFVTRTLEMNFIGPVFKDLVDLARICRKALHGYKGQFPPDATGAAVEVQRFQLLAEERHFFDPDTSLFVIPTTWEVDHTED